MEMCNFSTRQDYEDCLVRLCDNIKPFFCEDKSGLELGYTATLYDNKTIGLEGFSRLLWGLVPLWAGGTNTELHKEILSGIKNGTNPHNSKGWGTLCNEHQAFVEMAPMALGLLLVPEIIWDPLSEEEKKNWNQWLLQINQYSLPKNNWYFFRILVNIGLRNVGGDYNEHQIAEDFKLIESCYLGDGWYSDGKTMQRDYYISFAMHFYSIIYAKTMRERDKQRCELMIDRAKIFAKDFIYWFAEDGAALPYGRSLTYRFAQCAFWSALVWADIEVYSFGVMKGIINRHFRYWFSKPILDRNGVLTIGYGYPNLNMAEGYNAPGSPYWAFKSFLILALPKSHPFWQAEEEPLIELDSVKTMKHSMMVLTRPEKNHVVALASGQYPGFDPVHSAEKYAKFAYSSRYAFHVPRSYYRLEQAAPDNMLAFLRDGIYYVRRQCKNVIIENNILKSSWSPFPGIEVETTLEAYGNGHKRTHIIRLEESCDAVEGGFGIPVDNYRDMNKSCTATKACIFTDSDVSTIEICEGEGTPGEFLAEANTNLLYPRTVIPYISYHFEKGVYKVSVFVAAGSNNNL